MFFIADGFENSLARGTTFRFLGTHTALLRCVMATIPPTCAVQRL